MRRRSRSGVTPLNDSINMEGMEEMVKTLVGNVRVSAELFERLVNTMESLNNRIARLEIEHEQLETRTNLRDYFVPPVSDRSPSATRYTWGNVPREAARASTFPPVDKLSFTTYGSDLVGAFGGITSEPSSGVAAAPPPPLPLPPSPPRPSLT